MHVTVLLLLLATFQEAAATEGLTFIPLPVSQPVPCACLNTTDGKFLRSNSNCTDMYSAAHLKHMDDNGCAYPWPQVLLDAGYNATCRSGRWETDDGVDLVVPSNTLVDFCISKVLIRGNVYIPKSANISTFQPLNGTASNVTHLENGQLEAYGVLSNAGWLLLVLQNTSVPVDHNSTTNSTAHSETKVLNPPPADGSTYVSIFKLKQKEPVPFSFESANRTQFWQNGYFSVPCQTITPQIGIVQTGNGSGTLVSEWSITIGVINQCEKDFKYFVGFVAGIGGFIILFTIGYAIFLILKAIYNSINAPVSKIAYLEMDRGEESSDDDLGGEDAVQ